MAQTIECVSARFEAIGVELSDALLDGEAVLRVVKPKDNTEPDVPTYAALVGPIFHDGTIEVEVRARLMPWADVDCRGFIGIAFRAQGTDSFESFYVRPRNGRSCTDLRRRIHTMQYFSYPRYTFSYFRERGIADFEAPADIDMDEWVSLRAELRGAGARFYVNDMDTPALVVPAMFRGAEQRGSVGLYVDNGTEGFFRNLRVHYDD